MVFVGYYFAVLFCFEVKSYQNFGNFGRIESNMTHLYFPLKLNWNTISMSYFDKVDFVLVPLAVWEQ